MQLGVGGLEASSALLVKSGGHEFNSSKFVGGSRMEGSNPFPCV